MSASDIDAAASKPVQDIAHAEEFKGIVTANSVASVGKDHPQGDAIRTQVSTS
jgi:hypothetical protein